MKKIEVNCTNASYKGVLKICKKCGFYVVNGGDHDLVKNNDGKKITTIPRHNYIKRETARSIFTALQEAGAPIAIIK